MNAPARERLTTMLLLAGLLHAIVILGLGFQAPSPSRSAPALEVLLVGDQLPEARRRDTAAYLAQRSQQGGGNTRELPTGSPPTRSAAAMEAERRAQRGKAAEMQNLSSTVSRPRIQWQGVRRAAVEAQPSAAATAINGRGDAHELLLRGDPSTGRWLMPDTQAAVIAPYLDAWRRKVERIGTQHYPAAARARSLARSPVIEVVIESNGSLKSAAVQDSSGQAELDAAALQILKLASPFERFPKSLLAQYRQLRFAYQWEFEGGRSGAVVTARSEAPSRP